MITDKLMKRPITIEEWSKDTWTAFQYGLLLFSSPDQDKGDDKISMVDNFISIAIVVAKDGRGIDLNGRKAVKLFDGTSKKYRKLFLADRMRYNGNAPMAFAAIYLLANLEFGVIKRSKLEKVLDHFEPIAAEKVKHLSINRDFAAAIANAT